MTRMIHSAVLAGNCGPHGEVSSGRLIPMAAEFMCSYDAHLS